MLRGGLQQAFQSTLWLFVLGAVSANQATALERYVSSSWGHKDGLLSTLIYAITQTRDGYLWLGTSDGLVRFDGINFVQRKLVANTEPPVGAVTALCAASSGSLWIGSASGLIARVAGTDLQKVHVEGAIRAIIESPEGDIWVIAENEIYRFGRVSSAGLVPSERIDPGQITHLLTSGASNVLLGSQAAPRATNDAAVQARKLSLSGLTFFLNRGKDGKNWLDSSSFPQDEEVSQVLHDRHGYLWSAGSTEGLVRRADNGRDRATELPNDFVEALFEDREGNVWAGTNNGLYRFSFGKIFSLTKLDGLPSGKVTSVETNRKAVWVGTQAGLTRIEGPRIQQLLRGLEVLSLKTTRDNNIWAGTTRGVFAVGDFENSPTVKPVTTELSSVTVIEEDAAGYVWLADALKGLHRWKDGVLTNIGSDLGLRSRRIASLRARNDGTLWIGFLGGGLALYQEGSFRELPGAEGPPAGTVNDIYAGDPNAVWFGTDSGLYRFDGKKFTTWNSEQGLPGNRVLWLRADGDDNFWLGFSTGIARIRRAELRTAGPISARNLRCDFYDSGDGLPANPVRQSQSAANLDSEGKLWLTTSAGVAVIDSRHIEKNVLPPPVVIDRVIADNHEATTGRPLQFPPHTKDIQFDYAGLSLVEPRKVQFRYRLEGYDNEWQNAGARRQAFYTNLGPGAYRFRVVAANNDGVWNEDGASTSFSVLPAFYQTQLFKLFCFAAAVVITWGLYRLRLQRMQAAWNARLEERLAERTRLAQDLHDELLQNAMGVSLQLEVTDSLIEETHAAKQHLVRALDLCRVLMQQGRDVLRDLRAKTRDAADVIRVLSRTIEGFQRQSKVVSSLIVEGTPRSLNPAVVEDFVQIGKQAVANAFQHAAAKKIEVRLIYGTSDLRLEVRDDGRGIDPRIAEAGKPGHFGLIGMKERAERIGGVLTIASRVGEGTSATVSVPGKRAFCEAKSHD